MPETTGTVITEVTPPISTPASAEVKVEAKPEIDLVTRVSQVKADADKTKLPVEEPVFDLKELEAIPDPAAKEQAMKAYKSFQRGFNQKFQELADLRKKYEQPWTPQRIQEELQKPDFIQAAQVVAQNQNPPGSGMSDDEYSALSDKERAFLNAKFQRLEEGMRQVHQQQFAVQTKAQDEELKKKYANYNSGAIDILTADLLQGKVQATREHLYKVQYHDENVTNAYQLGRMDERKEINEKIQAVSAQGVNATGQKEIPQPEKNEGVHSYFRKLVINNLNRTAQK